MGSGIRRGRGRRVSGVLAGSVILAVVLAGDLLVDDVVVPATAAIAPLVAASRDSWRRTAAVGAGAVAVAVAVGPADGPHLDVEHLVSIAVVTAAAAGGALLAHRRQVFEDELDSTRTVAELGQRLALAVEAAGLGTWRWDLLSGAVSWDAGTAQLFGVAPDTFGGTFDDWLAAVHPDDRDAVRSVVADGMRSGAGWVVEHRVVHGTGAVRWVEGRAEIVRDRDGTVVGATGIALDVTERRARERRRSDDQRVLEAALAITSRSNAERVDDAVRAACAAARDVFGADAATYLAIDGDHVRLVHHDAEASEAVPGSIIALGDMPRTRDELYSLRPSIVTVDDPAADALTRFLMAAGGVYAAVNIPLAATGTPEAVLVLGWAGDAPPVERLDAFARFGDHVGWAVERARRYEAEAEAARLSSRLQAGLLVEPVLERSGVGARTAYRPGEARLLLGGDFFDAIGRPDGTVAFCIGDVSGHGPEEAALAAQVRAGWRALAMSGDEPAHWVGDLDRVVRASSVEPERFITVCCGSLDPTHRTLTVVSAGHPPPIVLGGAGGARVVDVPAGPPLGIGGAQAWVACPAELPREWSLVVYTDGLVEGRARPGSSERFGIERLAARFSEPDVDVSDAFLERLLDDVEAANGGRLDDDVAVLMLVPHGSPAVVAEDVGAVAAVLELGSRLDDVAQARSFVRRTLRAWGVATPVEDVVLATSELVTNAALHTGTRTWVRLTATHDAVRVEVGDGRPPPDELLAWARHPDTWQGTTGRGLVVVSQVAQDWGVRADGDGKVVWFEVPAEPREEAREGAVDVVFERVPARLLIAFEEHLETLVREARYVVRGTASLALRSALGADVDIDDVIQRYDPLRAAVRRAARTARASGGATVDARVAVPVALADDLGIVMTLVERFEALEDSGELLMLPAGEELSAFRSWLVEEIASQVRGNRPRPCPFT